MMDNTIKEKMYMTYPEDPSPAGIAMRICSDSSVRKAARRALSFLSSRIVAAARFREGAMPAQRERERAG